MEDNNQPVEQPAAQVSRIGNAGPSLTFIFTMLTMIIWGDYAGIYSGKTAIAIGLVQLACYIPYLAGAIILHINKSELGANIFFIFGVLFGGVGGLLNVLAGMNDILDLGVTTQMAAIPFLWGSLAMIPFVWTSRKELSAVSFVCFTAVIIFLALMMLPAYNIGPVEVWNEIIKWLMLIVAVTGCYTMMSDLNVQGGGKPYPQGAPLFK